MKRRNFFTKLFLGLVGSMGISGFVKSSNSSKKGPVMNGNFIHVVYFWLKEPADQEQNDLLLRNIKGYLPKIDVILDSFIGTPANTPRGVVDNSYDLSIILTFKGKKEQDIYQEHPVHLQFIEDSQHLWEKVQVYDSLRV